MTQPDLFLNPVTPTPLSPVAKEKQRLHAAALRVLAYLQQHGSATNVELSTPDVGGLRGVARCWELKKAGYPITKQKLHGGIYSYTLQRTATR